MALYDFQGKELARLGSPDGSAKRSLEATPMEAALAAGTDAGGVLVWDWAAQQVKEHYARQHAVGMGGEAAGRLGLLGPAGPAGVRSPPPVPVLRSLRDMGAYD